ncbi:MAG: hypothetical protein ACQEVA_15465 [Myxococcota bacterium]
MNTYLGSKRFERLLNVYASRIELVMCGHIHLGREAWSSGLRFVSNGSSYETKELVVWSGGAVARRAFEV